MNITDTKLEKVRLNFNRDFIKKNRSAETYKNHIKINLIFIHQKRVKQIFLISALRIGTGAKNIIFISQVLQGLGN